LRKVFDQLGRKAGFGVKAELELPADLAGLGMASKSPLAFGVVLTTFFNRAFVQLQEARITMNEIFNRHPANRFKAI
jgi:hypothetical protein